MPASTTSPLQMLRSCSLALLCCCCLAEEAPANGEAQVDYDVVFLTNGQRMLGLLEQLPSQAEGTVLLRTRKGGLIRLRPEQVESIRPSIDRRLGDLASQDRAGLLELSRYCLIEERREAALACLTEAHGKSELDPNHLRLLARLTDEIEGPEPALPLYRRCRDLGIDDQVTLARLDELEAAYREWEAAKAQALAEIGKLPEIQDGMEADPNWKAESPQWYNTCRITPIVDELGPRRNKLLEIRFEAGDKYKAALAMGGKFNVGSARRFAFYVLNKDLDGLAFSLALKTGQTQEYFESKPFRLKTGERLQEVSFDLATSDFKSAATEWAHRTAIQNLDDIREIQIQIQNQRHSGLIILDRIGFQGGDPGKL